MSFLETVRNFFSNVKPTSGFNPISSAVSRVMSSVYGIYNFVTVTVPVFVSSKWHNLFARSSVTSNVEEVDAPELPRYEGENPLLESVEEELKEATKTPEFTQEAVEAEAEVELELEKATEIPELPPEEVIKEATADAPPPVASIKKVSMFHYLLSRRDASEVKDTSPINAPKAKSSLDSCRNLLSSRKRNKPKQAHG